MENMMINGAIRCVKRGWKVFPLHTSKESLCSCGNSNCSSVAKHPRIRDWQHEATIDEKKIKNWWRLWPDTNIGIATGKISGIFVLDIDPRHGGKESFQYLVKNFGVFPKTITSNTGGGGFHLLFKQPNESIPNKANLFQGVDVRGDGGYIVAPPSIHQTGSPYSWTNSLETSSLLDAPEWLIRQIKKPFKVYSHSDVWRTGMVCEGARNNFLTCEAGKLRRLGLEQQQLMFELQKLNSFFCRPPLEGHEVSKICQSIARYANGRGLEITEPCPSWLEEPLPLASIISAPSMSQDLLPERFKDWVMDISDRMQVTPEFVAGPAIVAFSSIVGRKIGIFPKEHDKWLVLSNLWGLIVARPGYFKSPTIAEAMKPIEILSTKARQESEEKKSQAKARQMFAAMQLEAMKDAVKKAIRDGKKDSIESLQEEVRLIEEEAEAAKLIERRYKTNDATVEKIARLMNENPNGLLLLRDELNGWLQSMGKAGREGDREFFLESWNGYGSYSIDRVGSGTLHVPALCLSVFGGIQPGKLQAYVEKTLQGNAEDDGLLQRFQVLIYPELSKEWSNIDRAPNACAEQKVIDVFEAMASVKVNPTQAIPSVCFSKAAQELFNEWRKDLEARLRSNDIVLPAFESHLAKYRSLMPSLSLLFWILEDPNNVNANSQVSLIATKKAIEWCEFLEKHAVKAYAIGHNAQTFATHRLSQFIEQGEINDGMAVRSIYRKQWAQLGTVQLVDSALANLEELGWLRLVYTTVQGGRTRKIELHPKFCSNNKGEKHGSYQIKNSCNGTTKNYSNAHRRAILGTDRH
jgi:hypothetical protein